MVDTLGPGDPMIVNVFFHHLVNVFFIRAFHYNQLNITSPFLKSLQWRVFLKIQVKNNI